MVAPQGWSDIDIKHGPLAWCGGTRGAVVVLALAASAAGGASPRTNGLGAAGWSTAPPAPGEADIPCTLERLATLGGATFLSQYAGKKPFILSAGGVDGTLARHAASWARQEFLERFGAAEVAVGKPISREAVRTNRDVPLRDYADGLLAPQIANEPDPAARRKKALSISSTVGSSSSRTQRLLGSRQHSCARQTAGLNLGRVQPGKGYLRWGGRALGYHSTCTVTRGWSCLRVQSAGRSIPWRM